MKSSFVAAFKEGKPCLQKNQLRKHPREFRGVTALLMPLESLCSAPSIEGLTQLSEMFLKESGMVSGNHLDSLSKTMKPINNFFQGEIGHVQIIKTTSRDSPLPAVEYLATSGGIFHDSTVHDIDIVTWMVGEYPYEVYSASNAIIPEIKAVGDFDNVTVTMRFPSGK